MAEHPNAAIYKRTHQLLTSGDIDRYLDHVSQSILWWEIDKSEPIKGKAALAYHLKNRPSQRFDSELHDILANEEHLVALIHAVARTGDERIDLSYAEVLHFDEGLISKRQVFPSNVRTAAAFFDIE